ncbi:MAG TPA: flagellar biosynthesis protein FlhB [Lachnospiraceae bacterium]|jgi:flagellar biosynthetic protein FlhB|uniref:flagellar biosynthesis protein FlhB n=1 Tax=Roseburia sp. AM59-24XD TaxID=2293138 RepID=UPI000E5101FB|nr:flagellar biosynthesis protein FlhB [Roseburia sp. AM59-24XD]MBS5665226.1 flagellar biosynthesis protein FlhB [Roseburia sp.]RHP86800.1 flagellar biosynthesis protein FlhB [Roseburia sp. AM59-24XD]HCS15480.1 flagellar biosynthesis protein FlhB [Lachnospiraceae bacterium]
MQQEACEKHYYLSYDLQLFAKEGQDGEKTEEPTAKKLEDARKKGQVMRSTEVVTAATLLAFFFMLKIFVGFIGNRFMTSFRQTIGFISDYTSEPFTLNTARTIIRGSFWNIIVAAFPIMIVGLVVTIVAIVFQVKWKVTAEPLKPKFDKFNPVTGMKRLFSKDKIMDLFKSIAKVVILAYVVYSYLKNQWPLIYKMYSYTLPQAIAVIGDTVINVGIRISALFAVIAMFDLFYQKWKYHQDMMMSKQEVKDEYKNSEGDPKVKSQQKQRMQQASQRRMMQDLPNADVVITNPTHLAVAIKYDKDTNEAPVVVAKGADYLAQKIKDRARENAIEIVENKPLARMLYHNVEIGAEIPPELYQMVAEVLAYVYSLTGRVN